jgi:hypothetical protein
MSDHIVPINQFKQMPGLGRIAASDPRDMQHRMSAVVPTTVTVSRRIWPVRILPEYYNAFPSTAGLLDQGTTSQCTAAGGEHFLMAGPVFQAPYLTMEKFYALNQKFDEWPGSETEEPRYQGSSVHAVMRILKSAGLVSEYVWAFSSETVRRWVLMNSPVIVGTDWLSGMQDSSSSGFIRARGSQLGGHCYVIIGADDNLRCPDGSRGAFLILNSWGPWGYKKSGRAFISYRDMHMLIKNHGEAATALEFLNAQPINLEGVTTLP